MGKDTLSQEKISELLGSDFKVLVFDEASSTNDLIKEYAAKQEEGLLIVANRQTSGRGRMGRSFYSPENSGIYMSLLLKPNASPQKTLFITTAAAVAVCRALEEISGKKMGIKWVNDVYLGDKKVCGILTEASVSPDGQHIDYAVLGIGINVFVPENDFTSEIKDIAGAIFDIKPEKDVRNRIIVTVIAEFWKIYKSGLDAYLEEYKRRSVLCGKEIFVINKNEKRSAHVIKINDDLSLKVCFENGEVKDLLSGDVSIRRK